MKHTVTELVLKNGARGLLINIPDASVMTFDINFRAGDYLVPKEKWETPHLMEHILLGANEMLPRARLFQAEFEKNGAYGNASTSTYDITYEAECADFEWDRIFGLLLIAITKPLFLEEEFLAEFGNVREELMARSNNHFRHLSLALRNKYGFYAQTDQERLRLMDNVVIEDVREHYLNTHTTKNLRFVIAGKLDKERTKVISELLDALELPNDGERKDLPKEVPQRLGTPLYLQNDTVDNLYFYVDTFMQRRMTNEEGDAISLINTMLTETLYSRILGTARERGLVYSLSSGFGQARVSTNWWFGAQVMPGHAKALFEIMINELNDVLQGQLEPSDIDAAKQYALGRYQRSGQTVGGTAGGYSGRYFFDGYIDDYYKIPERIEAITKDAIVGISRAMFSDNVGGLGVLGNCGEEFAHELHAQVQPLWHARSKD